MMGKEHSSFVLLLGPLPHRLQPQIEAEAAHLLSCLAPCPTDRTPKQKLKLHTTAEPLLTLFKKYKDAKGKQAKLKSPGQLQELLNITRQLLQVCGCIHACMYVCVCACVCV